jgi:hypothetical protein
MLRTVRVQTRTGSTYLIGPAADPAKVRIARVGAAPVRGTESPHSLAWDADAVELVPGKGGLRLRIRDSDGRGFESTEIISVASHELSNPASWQTADGDDGKTLAL